MTCFVGHLNKKGYFAKLGIEVTKENAKAIEHEIAKIVGREGEHCPEIWMQMKAWLDDPKKRLELEGKLRRKFGAANR